MSPILGAGAFWPVADGDVLPGDQYVLYSNGRFNDTPVLIGTNSDEGAMFVPQGPAPAAFEAQTRRGYGNHADKIIAAYPHSSPAEAATAARNLFRDTGFAWHTWSWARLQTLKGKGDAYIYYFDHRTPTSPSGANHAADLPYVFGSLGVTFGGPPMTPRPEDVRMSELMMSYWTNFAKTGHPNGRGLPDWPAFTETERRAMIFDTAPSARRLPNLDLLQVLDAYYAWRRAQPGKQ